MAILDDYSAKIIRQDHETLTNITHPQSNGRITGPALPILPELNFMLLVQPGDVDSSKTIAWQGVSYNTSSNVWSASTGYDSSTLGKAVALSACQLMVRAATTDGTPINVLLGGNEFWAKILSSPASLGGNKWKYAWQEVRRTASGWEDTPNGRSGTTSTGYALNSIESGNDGSGVEGNSIDRSKSDYPTGFSMQPVQGLPVVRMYVDCLSDGSLAYTFEYVNGEDGTCS